MLRKLFRRPSFVPPMSEIYLEKHLFIVHKDSPTKLSLVSSPSILFKHALEIVDKNLSSVAVHVY